MNEHPDIPVHYTRRSYERDTKRPPGIPAADRIAGFKIGCRHCGTLLAEIGRFTFPQDDGEPFITDRAPVEIGQQHHVWTCPKCSRPARLGVARMCERIDEQHAATPEGEQRVDPWLI